MAAGDEPIVPAGHDEMASAEELANTVLGSAFRDRASDIHFDPYGDDKVRVRFRVDGILQDRWLLPTYKIEPFINRLKVLANLDISNHAIPQDGRFDIIVSVPKRADGSGGDQKAGPKQEQALSARISVFMTVSGEAIVLRVLNRSELLISLENSEFDADTLARCRALFAKNYGMVLVTGPSGSGKTTLLYSILQEINSHEKNIITLEDPVEYRFDGMRQVQIVPEQGLTFAVGMKSILRQDPDVIMIGEIRDPETAEYAVRASLVGRLVFSTVHANSSIGTIARLLDMNIERSLIAYGINGVISKRLIRKICDSCRTAYTPESSLMKYFGFEQGEFTKGAGCNACNNTGYLGRTSIIEVMEFDEGMRSLILEKAPITALQSYGEGSDKMKTLRQSARERILAGITTAEEAARFV
jgi:type IV pilus assembly protein PilB